LKRKIIFLIAALMTAGCAILPKEKEKTPAPQIRVLLKEISRTDSIQFQDEYTLYSEEASYIFGKNNKQINLRPISSGYKIFNKNRLFTFAPNENVLFKAKNKNSKFAISGIQYSGNLLITNPSAGIIRIINRIDLEEYLKGVVPAEIPSARIAYKDAVKAQAICARTYALKRMESRSAKEFDVFGDERDQVYKGLAYQTSLSNLAVEETRGDVLVYGDSLATVYYHSTCGGMLESSDAVWAGASEPYLINEQDGFGEEFACRESPYFRWTEKWTLNEIDSLFSSLHGKSHLPKTVKDTTNIECRFTVTKRTPGGRVASINLIWPDTTVTLKNYEIRRFFSTKKGRPLPSTFFSISSEGDSLLVFEGAGFGHGVGMCQWGALNMSQQGIKYFNILVNKYFRGTFLKKVY